MRPLQAEIIQTLKVKAEIDPAKELITSIGFIKDYLYRFPFLKTLVLGISGGQDSTLAGKICQLACQEMREETGQEAYQFIAVKLPYGQQADAADVEMALDFISPDQIQTVNIKAATDAMVTALETNDQDVSDFNKGNIKARQRMVAQYGIAGAQQGVVVGTDHAAEAVTGFYTKFGDGAADIMPLWRLNKSQGQAILSYLNCPEDLFLNKVPTADLEDNKPGLADEEALGVSYAHIDAYLRGERIPDQAAERIEQLYLNSQHKRHLPITVYDHWWKK
ncbi:ammonia-dependent NAD(+) synthetase [Aerococcus kribbianus]|uniref:NH(3)-dependent NAD(+) synthetase n=1 Tax=Aerococcus kribbianus TaxID=2999064 RepID=A0A9X3FMX3_9LACT|nr:MULTISPECIES: ammonia-dependent NAD(+) synthetase [unclassified Aerococcus]MCZ0717507.1 ammonia-dependent NAD(+) synthetase [Aerococcus sp. YH-aer221]MCZ0725795.1 ammonia-dependent NAD(+) synthetase [Aerococcus sp. YH-aer222]